MFLFSHVEGDWWLRCRVILDQDLTMVTGHWSNTLLLDHHQDIHHSPRHELVQEQFVGTTEIGQKDCHRSIFSPLCRHVSYVRLLIDTWCYNSLLCLLNTKAGQNLSRILQYRYVRFGQGTRVWSGVFWWLILWCGIVLLQSQCLFWRNIWYKQ